MNRPTVAIIGASPDRSKYGNISFRAHVRGGYEVFAVNPNAEEVEGLPAYASLDDLPVDRLDRVSAYVQPRVLLGLLDAIARKAPGEVWLNPGTDTSEVVEKAEALGLNVIRGCSLIDARSPGVRSSLGEERILDPGSPQARGESPLRGEVGAEGHQDDQG